MTKKQLREIVSLFNDGSCSYQILIQAFPSLTTNDLYDLIEDNFTSKISTSKDTYGLMSFDNLYPEPPRTNYEQAIIRFKKTPSNYYSNYKFSSTDTFVLSEQGQDIYDEIIESKKQKRYNIAMLILATIAAVTGIISCIG